MASESFRFSCILLFSLVTECMCGSQCYYYSYAYSAVDSYYCDAGCCGYYYNRECCSNIGTIVGATIGAVIVVALIIGVVACCVTVHKAQTRRIKQKQAENAAIVTIVNTGGMTGPYPGSYVGIQQPYGSAHPPPDYSPFGPSAVSGTSVPVRSTGGMITTSFMSPPPYAEKVPLH